MTVNQDWRFEGVKVARAARIKGAMTGPFHSGRATVFDFTGSGGQRTWIGSVALAPGANTGAHHHGRHEVMIYVVSGRCEIRWGDRLEFLTEIGPGDFAYFPPYVPHQERNLEPEEVVEFVVVRSDNERIAVDLPLEVTPQPERVAEA